MGYMREFFLNHCLILIRFQIAVRLLHGRNKTPLKNTLIPNLSHKKRSNVSRFP
jgi:hypothetical protein